MRRAKRIIIAFLFLLGVLCLNACGTNSSVIELEQRGNGSSGSYWEYSLSNNDVIKETDYYETRFLGPGYTQHWTFEIINDGDVTIHWKAFAGGHEHNMDSYDEVYSVRNGKIYRNSN